VLNIEQDSVRHKHFMKSKIKTVFTILAASGALLCQQAQAVPITGNITFKGGVILNGTVATATQVSTWVDSTVESRDGDFSSVAVGSAVAMATPWVFAAATPALWSVGGFSFSFDAGSAVTRTASSLIVEGTGIITGPGTFTATPGVWNFTTQSPSAGGTFSFSAASGAEVPEGGLTVAMLGIALTGLGLLRRKLSI